MKCSAQKVGGKVAREIEEACAAKYLKAELACLPNAYVLALGGKAQKRLKRAGVPSMDTRNTLAPAQAPNRRRPGKRRWMSFTHGCVAKAVSRRPSRSGYIALVEARRRPAGRG